MLPQAGASEAGRGPGTDRSLPRGARPLSGRARALATHAGAGVTQRRQSHSNPTDGTVDTLDDRAPRRRGPRRGSSGSGPSWLPLAAMRRVTASPWAVGSETLGGRRFGGKTRLWTAGHGLCGGIGGPMASPQSQHRSPWDHGPQGRCSVTPEMRRPNSGLYPTPTPPENPSEGEALSAGPGAPGREMQTRPGQGPPHRWARHAASTGLQDGPLEQLRSLSLISTRRSYAG